MCVYIYICELDPLLDLVEELKDLLPEHAHFAREGVIWIVFFLGLFEHSLILQAMCRVRPVDEEKISSPHVVRVDHQSTLVIQSRKRMASSVANSLAPICINPLDF